MKAGVLIASYGAPRSLEEIESYFTHIRRGHPPKPEELADLVRRYRAVGGTDRLLRETERQVAALRRVLAALLFPDELPLVSAYRHAPPYLEDGVRALAAQGVRSILLLPLAPHYSPAHHVEYVERVRRAAESLGLEAHVVEDFGNHPCLVAWWAEAVRKAWEDADSYVLFTAHSLPCRRKIRTCGAWNASPPPSRGRPKSRRGGTALRFRARDGRAFPGSVPT